MSDKKNTLERMLESRLSPWAGTAVVTPLLVLLILFGSLPHLQAIVLDQADRILPDFLMPPPEPDAELFEKSLLVESADLEELTKIDDDIELPEDNIGTPLFETEEPKTFTRTTRLDPRVRSLTVDPERITTNREEVEDVPMAAKTPSANKDWVLPGSPSTPGGSVNTDEVFRGPSTDEDGAPGIGLRDGRGVGPVSVVRVPGGDGSIGRSSVDLGEGASVTGEKPRIAEWILENQGPLPSVMSDKLAFDPVKDVSAVQRVEAQDALYDLFLVYRRESNLLRILVVRGDDVFVFSLPGFEIRARYIQVGSAEWTSGLDRVVEVSLRSVDTIPEEATRIFAVVLRWLDIVKSEE